MGLREDRVGSRVETEWNADMDVLGISWGRWRVLRGKWRDTWMMEERCGRARRKQKESRNEASVVVGGLEPVAVETWSVSLDWEENGICVRKERSQVDRDLNWPACLEAPEVHLRGDPRASQAEQHSWKYAG